MTTTGGLSLGDRLLDAAEEEVALHGVAGFSVRAAARRVGVSHQAPLHHFGSGAGMLTALAARGFEALSRHLIDSENAVPENADVEAAVAAIGNAYVRFGISRPALFAAMFRPQEQFVENDTLTAARLETFGVLRRCVTRAKSAGWAATYDDETLVFACWAVVHGTVMLWRDGTAEIFFPGADITDVGTRVTNALLAAFGSA